MEVRKASPVVMIAQTIRASLLANATATTLAGLRALSAASQSHNAPLRFGAARKTEMAPNTRSRRIYRLPCLVIDPNFSLPPVEFCLGVAPSQAAKSRPNLKACGSGALARIAEAASAPTPGTLAASRLTGSRRWSATIARSSSSIAASRDRNCASRTPSVAWTIAGRSAGSLDEFLDVADPFGGDDTELRQMTPQGVHAHRALLDQQFTGLVRHQCGLLVLALDGDETHVWPRHRLADRRRIRRVILAALDIGLHVNRRREFHLVAHRAKPPRPIMRRAASLHADRARLDLGKEFDDPRTAQFTFRGGTIFALQRVDLKGILGDVDANSDIFPHGRSPSWWRSSDHLSALDAPTVGPSPSSRAGG